jgi:hypothetical protein
MMRWTMYVSQIGTVAIAFTLFGFVLHKILFWFVRRFGYVHEEPNVGKHTGKIKPIRCCRTYENNKRKERRDG